MPRPKTNDAATADVRWRNKMLVQHQAWVAYLNDQLALKNLPTGAASPHEANTTADQERKAIERRIAALATDLQVLFAAVCQDEKQRVQQEYDQQAGDRNRHVDPDEVERIALDRLRAEARGEHSPDQRGRVPTGKPGEIKWFAIAQEAMNTPPDAAAYALGAGQSSSAKGRNINLAIGVIVLCLMPIIYFLLQGGPPPAVVQGQVSTTSGEVASTWSVQHIHGVDWTLPITTTTQWPTTPITMTAMLLDGQFPLQMCLPGAKVPQELGMTVRLTTTEWYPARVYERADLPLDQADLVLRACDDPTLAPVPARFTTSDAPVPHAVGEPVAIDEQKQLTLTRVTTIGPGAEPMLPADQMRVQVVIALDPPTWQPDWTRLAPTLLLPSGEAMLPADAPRTLDNQQVILSYLIPARTTVGDAAWQVQGATTQRYGIALEPPLDRTTILRAALEPTITVKHTSAETVQVQVQVKNASSTDDLYLVPSDVMLTANEQVIPVSVTLDPSPLAPQAQRAFLVEIPRREGAVLSLGPFRYVLEGGEALGR